MSEEPLTHIARTPLPWRDATKTVCGHPVSQYADGLVLNLADAQAMLRRLGKQRMALVTCMTCAHNIGHWAEWDRDPVGRMERECSGGGYRRQEPMIEGELRAIAELIRLHRDEFDELVTAFTTGDVPTMQSLRQRRSTRRTV